MGEVSARELERAARSSDAFSWLVRLGLVGYGVLHLIVAWVSVRVAFGYQQTSGQGALAALAHDVWGLLLLLALVLGFAILAVWQAVAGLVGYRDLDGRQRLLMRAGAGCRVVTYGYLAVMTTRIVIERGASTGSSPRSTSAGVLAQPLGRVLLCLGGVVTAAVGIGLIVFGLRRGFLGQLDERARTGSRRLPIVVLGQAGYVTKGLAFVVIGGLVAWAGITDDPSRTGGLDQSLEKLVGAGLGVAAVVVVGVGIGCFGIYLLARARHLRRRTLTS